MKIKLRALRYQKQMKADEVAKQLGVSARTLTNYETGKTKVSFYTAYKLSQIYETPLNQIDFNIKERSK